jgi:hypothetical protein
MAQCKMESRGLTYELQVRRPVDNGCAETFRTYSYRYRPFQHQHGCCPQQYGFSSA